MPKKTTTQFIKERLVHPEYGGSGRILIISWNKRMPLIIDSLYKLEKTQFFYTTLPQEGFSTMQQIQSYFRGKLNSQIRAKQVPPIGVLAEGNFPTVITPNRNKDYFESIHNPYNAEIFYV